MCTEIKPEWISIVIQGQVLPELLPKNIASIRQCFPGSEIILSTWKGSDITGAVSVDKIICSPDPGAFCADDVVGTLNNVNRQIVSTQAGLAAATRPYILKTRTDILIHDRRFISFWGKYDDVPSQYFQNRLLICNYYTRNPRVFATCFHPSDWIVFGRAGDVRAYYENIPFMTQEEGNWFRNHSKASVFFTNYLCRFTPEQHIFLGFLRKYDFSECTCYYDHRLELVVETERAFAECFVVLDYQKQLSITFPKYDPNRYLEKHTIISHWMWRAMYQHYCEGKTSFLWLSYRMYGLIWESLSCVRTLGVRILDRLGIKEAVKRLLSSRGGA